MAFCHAGMAWKALLPQQVATDGTMLDVGFLTVTMNARRITLVDAYIVQHGSLL
jgi:hypothetical protein